MKSGAYRLPDIKKEKVIIGIDVAKSEDYSAIALLKGGNVVYTEEAQNISEKELNKAMKIIDKGYIKQHPSIIFWRLVPHKHKANLKKTHIMAAPGLFCSRCWRWHI